MLQYVLIKYCSVPFLINLVYNSCACQHLKSDFKIDFLFPGCQKRSADSRFGERQVPVHRSPLHRVDRRCSRPQEVQRTFLQVLVNRQPRSHLFHGHG